METTGILGIILGLDGELTWHLLEYIGVIKVAKVEYGTTAAATTTTTVVAKLLKGPLIN